MKVNPGSSRHALGGTGAIEIKPLCILGNPPAACKTCLPRTPLNCCGIINVGALRNGDVQLVSRYKTRRSDVNETDDEPDYGKKMIGPFGTAPI